MAEDDVNCFLVHGYFKLALCIGKCSIHKPDDVKVCKMRRQGSLRNKWLAVLVLRLLNGVFRIYNANQTGVLNGANTSSHHSFPIESITTKMLYTAAEFATLVYVSSLN